MNTRKNFSMINNEDFQSWCKNHWILYASTTIPKGTIRFYVNINKTFKITLGNETVWLSNDFEDSKKCWNEAI